jgi:hypothetical protein
VQLRAQYILNGWREKGSNGYIYICMYDHWGGERIQVCRQWQRADSSGRGRQQWQTAVADSSGRQQWQTAVSNWAWIWRPYDTAALGAVDSPSRRHYTVDSPSRDATIPLTHLLAMPLYSPLPPAAPPACESAGGAAGAAPPRRTAGSGWSI